MPHRFDLPEPLGTQGWKLKIRERESREPPHVTIIRRTMSWRWDLRTKVFMDVEPDPAMVPDDLKALLIARHLEISAAWDDMYPLNPVAGEPDDGNEDRDTTDDDPTGIDRLFDRRRRAR